MIWSSGNVVMDRMTLEIGWISEQCLSCRKLPKSIFPSLKQFHGQKKQKQPIIKLNHDTNLKSEMSVFGQYLLNSVLQLQSLKSSNQLGSMDLTYRNRNPHRGSLSHWVKLSACQSISFTWVSKMEWPWFFGVERICTISQSFQQTIHYASG